MISEYNAKNFCCEDISKIENYLQAVTSTEQYHCHHRKETDENLTMDELKEMGLYYNRPADELIFLTEHDHMSLHNKGERNYFYGVHLNGELNPMYDVHQYGLFAGEKNPMYGKKHTEEARKKDSDAVKKYWKSKEGVAKRKEFSESFKGEKNPMYGKNSEDFMTEEAIREKRRKYSESMKGVNKNRKWMNNGAKNAFVSENEVGEYIKNGYVFGMIRGLHNN